MPEGKVGKGPSTFWEWAPSLEDSGAWLQSHRQHVAGTTWPVRTSWGMVGDTLCLVCEILQVWCLVGASLRIPGE